MPRYKFTEQAERDLDAIVEYTLENWGQSQEALLGSLALTPALGLNQGAVFKELLNFPYVGHVVCYVKSLNSITVIRILHKRMDTKKHISATLLNSLDGTYETNELRIVLMRPILKPSIP
jgi:toxin ParE1/3/4